MPTAFRIELAAIAADNRSGAAVLATRAARALIALAAKWGTAGFEPVAEAAALAVAGAQPAMAPMYRLANEALWASCDRDAFIMACLAFAERLETSEESVARRSNALLAEGSHVLTHSFSRAVLRSLVAAHDEGRRFRVIVTESRPMNEGVTLARELAARGIDTALVVDAAANRFMDRASIVLTGADSTTDESVINKIGTGLIALAAKRAGKPAYALCSSLKIAPPDFGLHEAPRPAEELLADAAGFKVWNFYFEATPLDLFAGIVTEDGVLSPAEIARRSLRLHIHPALMAPKR